MLVLDVDGVLTDGKLYFDHAGNEMKAFNTRDGLGMKALQRCGIEVAVITGRKSAAVEHRMSQLGIQHVYQGAEDRVKEQVHWITKRNGGDGAVREICNLILAAQNKEQTVLDEILAS